MSAAKPFRAMLPLPMFGPIGLGALVLGPAWLKEVGGAMLNRASPFETRALAQRQYS